MSLPTSFESLCIPVLEIIENKGKGHSTNFTGIYTNISDKLNLTKSEIVAEIEEDVFAIKEMIKIVRDGLLGSGLLKGTANSFELSKNGRTLLKFFGTNILFDFSKVPTEIYNAYQDYIENRDYNITINEIEYTAKGWERKVFKFAEEFNLNSKKQKINISKKENSENINIDYETTNIKRKIRETILEIIENHEVNLKKELLEKLKRIGHFQFEELSVNVVCDCIHGKITEDLKKEVSVQTKKTGDGGIDGIVLHKGKMGERKYYIQSKKYTNGSVGSPEIDSFFAALSINLASDGLLITTSTFSKPALERIKEFEAKKNVKIIAIDGEELLKIMLENKIGTKNNVFELNEIDENYFKALK